MNWNQVLAVVGFPLLHQLNYLCHLASHLNGDWATVPSISLVVARKFWYLVNHPRHRLRFFLSRPLILIAAKAPMGCSVIKRHNYIKVQTFVRAPLTCGMVSVWPSVSFWETIFVAGLIFNRMDKSLESGSMAETALQCSRRRILAEGCRRFIMSWVIRTLCLVSYQDTMVVSTFTSLTDRRIHYDDFNPSSGPLKRGNNIGLLLFTGLMTMTSTFPRTKKSICWFCLPHPAQDPERRSAALLVGFSFSKSAFKGLVKVIVHGHVGHPNLDLFPLAERPWNKQKQTQDKQNEKRPESLLLIILFVRFWTLGYHFSPLCRKPPLWNI